MARMLPARNAAECSRAGFSENLIPDQGRLAARGEPCGHAQLSRGDAMSHDSEDADVPWMQKLLDNPFLLLFLGVLIPMVVYTLWGVIDILTIPVAK
jgi:hypothetical protein